MQDFKSIVDAPFQMTPHGEEAKGQGQGEHKFGLVTKAALNLRTTKQHYLSPVKVVFVLLLG